MLLSVPLTMMCKIMLENTEDLRWVAILLGPAEKPALLDPPAETAQKRADAVETTDTADRPAAG